jgi:hypothetical protein
MNAHEAEHAYDFHAWRPLVHLGWQALKRARISGFSAIFKEPLAFLTLPPHCPRSNKRGEWRIEESQDDDCEKLRDE